ncbi:hypothetical protein B0H13DRAFT_1923550 [Mycena leptocephala]|nr:hypothetical protein B0H13DRAFT_1923550 [Mycena leptocephala]
MQGFDYKKITSGISGHLRQEFRELELLDEITKLRYEGRLPRRVTGIYRGQLLTSYRTWKGNAADPLHFHPAIRSKPDDEIKPASDYGNWKPTTKDRAKSATKGSKNKRQKPEHEDAPPAKKITVDRTLQQQSQPACPVGLIWDNINYSCAYDTLFTPLACLWRDNPEIWTQRLTAYSPLLGLWATVMAQNRELPENARDSVRRLLHFQNAVDYPTGPRGIKLDALFMGVTDRRSYGTAVTHCEQCGHVEPGVTETFSQYIDVMNTNALRQKYPDGPTLSQWFQQQFDQQTTRCPQCRLHGNDVKMRRLTEIHDVPSVMVLCINFNALRLDSELSFERNDIAVTLKLRGLIYHSQAEIMGHFTSVVVDAQDEMWYHDGMSTRRTCVNNGKFGDIPDLLTLHQRGGERLCAAIYALKE